MNAPQSKKAKNLQEPIPRCMGRMINIFDLSVGNAGTKKLTDRAHRESFVGSNQPFVPKKVTDPIPVHIVDKPVTYETKRSSSDKRYGGTPMKMLIAQEMSKEMETKRKPPSIVARLMGFDGLPGHEQVTTTQATIMSPYELSDCLCDMHISQLNGGARGFGNQENGYFETMTLDDIHPYKHHSSDTGEYRDVYEVRHQQSRMNHFRDQPTSKRRYNESLNEKRMALVRQKFMEAKRLATDQKLLQSKEFQDALEVLSSNRDLFLKFLEEPNSLFSKHLEVLQIASTKPGAKHITVLKPSMSMEATHGDKSRCPMTEDDPFDKDKSNPSPDHAHPRAENLAQPTRIVLLKPSPRKSQNLRSIMGSSAFHPGLLDDRYDFEDVDADGTRGARDVAKEITQQMRDSLSGNRRDDTLLSSILSNGYIGDESSFNRSDNEFLADDGGNFSDSDIITPTSRHSWDNVNRIDSPRSLSSLSRTSYSPESSVIREAKRRLSERWAMVASNGTSQEQRQFRRSSSTLGEMLAIPETRKEDSEEELTVSNCRSFAEQDVRLQTSFLSTNRADGSGMVGYPSNLPRSKSDPATSLASDSLAPNLEYCIPQVDKSTDPKGTIKPKSGKSSLKGKVSSLLFKNKKPSSKKSEQSPLISQRGAVQVVILEGESKSDSQSQRSHFTLKGDSQSCKEFVCGGSSRVRSENEAKQVSSPSKAALPFPKVRGSEYAGENPEQPSPVSVLEALFEDDVNSTSRSSERTNLESHRLVSRSPPIESVTRSLSWEDCHSKSAVRDSRALSEGDEEKEHYFFVKSLLSSAGLNDKNFRSGLVGWHSMESPLDPSLLDKFLERKEEDAKCRERRSNQRLLFDSVNAALLDISNSTISESSRINVIKCGIPNGGISVEASITEEVWGRLRRWFHGQKQYAAQGEDGSLVIDKNSKKVIAGSGWTEMISAQIDEIAEEVERKLLEGLVVEALDDLLS